MQMEIYKRFETQWQKLIYILVPPLSLPRMNAEDEWSLEMNECLGQGRVKVYQHLYSVSNLWPKPRADMIFK